MNQPATEFEIALTICAVIFIMSMLGMFLIFAHAWAKGHDLKIIRFEQGASKFGPMTEEAIAEANSPDQACAQDAFSIPLEIQPIFQRTKIVKIGDYTVFINDEEVPPSLHPQVDIFRVES